MPNRFSLQRNCIKDGKSWQLRELHVPTFSTDSTELQLAISPRGKSGIDCQPVECEMQNKQGGCSCLSHEAVEVGQP